jgi:hypothetical protein
MFLVPIRVSLSHGALVSFTPRKLGHILVKIFRSIMAAGCVRSFGSWDVFLMPPLCPLQCTSQSPFFLARFGCMVVLILLLLQCSDAAAQ